MITKEMMKCKYCESLNIGKGGLAGGVQRYKCKDCGRKFVSPSPMDRLLTDRQTIDECCGFYLADPVLKDGMADLLLFLRGLKMNPAWYHKSSYKCNYKGKRVVYINMGSENWLRIRVCTVSDMHGIGNMDLYMLMLSNELRSEFNNYLTHFQPCKVCKGCGGVCERRRSYYIDNPTREQFEWIKMFIAARMRFIDNPAV